jgi:ATPase subunit of ABC transporter with duplicated ATPase domains
MLLMSLLRATDLKLTFGDRSILEDVSFELSGGARVALTGRNGAGKTSLLRVIMGVQTPDSGSLEIQGRLAWLEQDADFGDLMVREVMERALSHLRELETRLRELEVGFDEAAQLEWHRLLEAFERAGGYAAQARATRTLEALGLKDFLDREANSLSGGERTRLALARVLVAQPDVLLLDEPTNHLDIAMREWLEKRLLDYPGALLIVSHDRRLLDAVCSQTMHLERGELTHFKGGYSKSRFARLEAVRVQSKQARVSGFELRRLERASNVVSTWGKNNDKLARRAKAIATRAERARGELVEAPMRERQIRMQLEGGDARAKVILRAEHIEKSFSERVILARADLRIRSGDRVTLLAPNGAGKTTLLRILLGELAPDIPGTSEVIELEPPEIRYADGVQPAYFDQIFHGLDPKQPVFDQIAARVGERGAQSLLGRYGFPKEAWSRSPQTLSGGERARAGLALIGATRADLLVLDEPTNHLDVETLEALEEAILAYPGSVLFVTHDRTFAQRVATRVLTIDHGELLEFARGFKGYEAFRKGQREFLDPARLLDGEAPPAPPKTLTPEQELQLLEERSVELEELFLYRGLTEREWHRLRLEDRRGLERRAALYADRYAAAHEFDHVMRLKPLEIRALSDDAGHEWQFWAKGSSGCPSLRGRFEDHVMQLIWLEPEREAMRWFKHALLKGAISLSFERINATAVELPEVLEPFGQRLSNLEYARILKLTRPPRKRRKRKAKAQVVSPTALPIKLEYAASATIVKPQASSLTITTLRKRRRRRKKPVPIAEPI